jgi:hypothetical protein
LVRALLSIDYDDGFIAYLNGKEIARNGLIGYPPPFDDFAAIDHEANCTRAGTGVFPY